MSLSCIFYIYDFLGDGKNWKDYIIPTVSPIIGVIGAYLIMKTQLNKQKKRDDLLEWENDSLHRSTYLINITLIHQKVPDVIKKTKELKNLLKKIDFSFNYFDIQLEPINIIQNYNTIYESFRGSFYKKSDELQRFIFSYYAVSTIKNMLDILNESTKDFNFEIRKAQSLANKQSSEFLNYIKLILRDTSIDEKDLDYIKNIYESNNIKTNTKGKEIEVFLKTCHDLLSKEDILHISTNNNVTAFVIFLKEVMQNSSKMNDIIYAQVNIFDTFIEITDTEREKIKTFTDSQSKFSQEIFSNKVVYL